MALEQTLKRSLSKKYAAQNAVRKSIDLYGPWPGPNLNSEARAPYPSAGSQPDPTRTQGLRLGGGTRHISALAARYSICTARWSRRAFQDASALPHTGQCTKDLGALAVTTHRALRGTGGGTSLVLPHGRGVVGNAAYCMQSPGCHCCAGGVPNDALQPTVARERTISGAARGINKYANANATIWRKML